MKSNPLLRSSSLMGLFAVSLALSPHLRAASGTWSNAGSTSADWSETSNWVGGTVPGSTSPSNADTATFNSAIGDYGTSGSPVLIDSSDLNLRLLEFTTASGGYTIGTTGGNSLHMNSPSFNGGIYLQNTITGTNTTFTINAPLVISTTGTSAFNIHNNSVASNSLVIAGGITGAANTATTNLSLRGNSASVNTISGIIADGVNNVVHVQKTVGSNTIWELTGSNTYSGVTTISAGTLRINSAQSLGDGSITNTIALGGGMLQSTGGTYDLGVNRTITLAGSPTIRSDAGTLTVSGAMDHAATGRLRVEGAGDTVLSGDISGSGLRLELAATGTVTLSGANTYSGNTTIINGTVKISAADNLGDGSASNSIFFSGGVLVTDGTFDLGSNRTITKGGSTRVQSDSGTLTLSGGISGIGLLELRGDGDITVTGAISHNNALTKSGNGTVRLTAANSYTGATTVNGGILRLDNASAISSANLGMSGGIIGLGSGDFTRAIGSDANQFKIDANGGGFAAYGADRAVNIGGDGATVGWSTTGFLTSGAVLTLGAADADKTVTFVNTLIIGSSGTNTRNIHVNDGSADVDAIMAANLSQTGGTQSFLKTGAGTLLLQGANNNYTGTTTVSAGTLLVDGGFTSGAVGGVFVDAAGTLGGGGTINRNVSVDGILQAGHGQTGQSLTLGGDLTMTLDSVLAFAIDGTSDSDFLARTGSGTWTFQDDQKVRITDLGVTGTTYTLITGLDASFGSLYDLANWQLVDSGDLDGTFSFASNTLYFNVIPEPGSLALVVAGCGALALLRRRHSTRRHG